MTTGDPRPDGMVWDDALGWTMPNFNPAQTLQDSIDKARAWDVLAEKNAEIARLRAALVQFVAACETAPPTSLMTEIGMACKVAKTALALPNGERQNG